LFAKTKMTNKNSAVFCHHLVGFFDVLGQSSRLRQLTKLPETDAERAEVIRLLKNTAGVVLGVRRMFRDFFQSAGTSTPFVGSLPAPMREQLLQATQADVTYRGISDSFIVTVCLGDTGVATTPVNGVYRAFVAASGMWLLSLSVGHPIRGGLDVGLGIDIEKDEVYGPVLDCAYHLESKVAGGPRIVVGDVCVDYLNFVSRRPADDIHKQIASEVARFCLSMLRQDSDGVTTLDPLGERMLELTKAPPTSSGNSIADRVKPAHDVVRQQLADAELQNDRKLIARYRSLLQYFDESASRWG
jgi:hypothetical protein